MGMIGKSPPSELEVSRSPVLSCMAGPSGDERPEEKHG